MTTVQDSPTALGATTRSGTPLADAARDHLWMHFTRQGPLEPTSAGGSGAQVPIIVRGDGAYVYDDWPMRIGNRIVVPKEKLCQWVDAQTGGDA